MATPVARAVASYPPAEAELLSLPDDALLAVLAYLPLRELFSCRVVCRRLRDLCLHPDLWRNAEVGGRGGLAVACFALAPCLRRLGSYLQEPVSEAQTFLEAGGTCVVARLVLSVYSPADAPHASAFIQKLSALGGLRSLNLVIGCSLDDTSALRLSEAVLKVKGIQELFVKNSQGDLLLPDPGCPVQASLTRLEYETNAAAADPFLWSLLEGHAATLEEVRLRGTEKEVPVTCLAKLLGLRALSCPPHEDMCKLLVLPKLDTVTLTEYYSDSTFPDGALDFLRRARHLRHVSLGAFDPFDSTLFALAESCSARAVESLTLYGQPRGEGLAAILPRLPSLKDLILKFYMMPDDFADAIAISPTSAPSLTKVSLDIWVYKPADFVCWHSWLHGGALPGLLKRNPRLHLEVKWRSQTRFPAGCKCPVCLQGCHTDLRAQTTFRFSSHGAEAECPLGCVQLTVSTS